ncbi:MAG: TRAP transporter substrate-binding protein [Spirochaetaceae bacterium]|nr:MAG: TRAP transporter substrate-binding protein [Spirochaetaceae bacterium]
MKRTMLFVLIIGLIASTALFAAGGREAATAQVYEWSLASVLPESHPVHKSLVFFADEVRQRTNGQIDITVYGGGQLGDERDYIEGIQLGTIDVTKVSAAPLGQFSDSLQVVSLPFIFRDQAHQHAVLRGEIGDRLMAELAQNGFKGLTFMDSGFRSVTTSTGPVRTPADMRGQKIRVMPSAPLIDTINALGATAVPMGQGEVYVGLQQGVIDGWENNEPTVIAFNMQEVAEYYSYTRHVSIPDILIMSTSSFNALPANLQTALMDAAAATAPFHTQIWNDYVEEAKRELAARGMVFNEVNDIRQFQSIVQPIYDQYDPIVGPGLIRQIMNK